MRRSDVEAMWAYVPDPRYLEGCRWLEIGRGRDGSRAAMTRIEVDRDALPALMAQHQRVHLYHFHPLIYFEPCRDGSRCGHLEVPISTNDLAEARLNSNLRYAMPSPLDIAFMIDVSRQFAHYDDTGGRIRHRVITPYGLVEYSLTAVGYKKLMEDGIEQERGRWGFDTYMQTMVSYRLSDAVNIAKNHPDDLIQGLTALANHLTNEYLTVTYFPMRE